MAGRSLSLQNVRAVGEPGVFTVPDSCDDRWGNMGTWTRRVLMNHSPMMEATNLEKMIKVSINTVQQCADFLSNYLCGAIVANVVIAQYDTVITKSIASTLIFYSVLSKTSNSNSGNNLQLS